MRMLIILATVLLVLCGGTYLSSYVVSERETVIVTQFGEVVRTVEKPGAYFKLPWIIHKVNRFDKRLNVLKTQLIQVLLGDKNPIIVDFYIAWRIGEPIKFFQSLSYKSNAEQKLNEMIVSELNRILSGYGIDNVINTDQKQMKLTEIQEKLLANSGAVAKDNYGIEIVQIGISRINYPDVVTEAVYGRMASEREKEADKLRAEGREEATKIRSKADRQTKEILAAAYKESEIIKGKGDKEAMRIYGEAYGQDPEFFDFLKSLEAYKEILWQSTLILSTDSELFKYLNPKEKRPAAK